MLYRNIFQMSTEKNNIYDVTESVKKIVSESKISDGVCNVFLTGTTAGLMINENNKMLFEDFKRTFEALAPEDRLYSHPKNAQSHIRASMISQNLTIPVSRGNLLLDTWQSILLWEFDVQNRERKIIVTIGY